MREKGKELEELLAKYEDKFSRDKVERLINIYFPKMEKEYPEFELSNMDFKTELAIFITICDGPERIRNIPRQNLEDECVLAAFGARSPIYISPLKEMDFTKVAQQMVKFVLMRDSFLRKKTLFDDEIDIEHSLQILIHWYKRVYYRDCDPKSVNGKKYKMKFTGKLTK